MRGHTHEIELEGELEAPAGLKRNELVLHGELERSDFGLSWNQTLDTGGVLLGARVRIELRLSVLSARAEA